ncbi:hypothetical protein B0I35DRAFT_122472 [Stachybotrys elegans]|uniref:Secreted protein n=1 Tax=Stachybotrys elegans TaxID=80388 RepID=A0A8K0SXP7_9HYPO|nr:hypothetical protein B0I35DRAFT_122472 [Stachybotrys elegans]
MPHRQPMLHVLSLGAPPALVLTMYCMSDRAVRLSTCLPIFPCQYRARPRRQMKLPVARGLQGGKLPHLCGLEGNILGCLIRSVAGMAWVLVSSVAARKAVCPFFVWAFCIRLHVHTICMSA